MSQPAPAPSTFFFNHGNHWGCEAQITIKVTKYRVEDQIQLSYSTIHSHSPALPPSTCNSLSSFSTASTLVNTDTDTSANTSTRACACRTNPDAAQEKANDELLARRLRDFWYAGQLSSVDIGRVWSWLKLGGKGDEVGRDVKANIREFVSRLIIWDRDAKVWVFKPWNAASTVLVANPGPAGFGAGALRVNL